MLPVIKDREVRGLTDFRGPLLKDGTELTVTFAELNALSAGGLSAAELAVLDGATAGTQVASKAVIADANVNTGVSKVTELHIGATGAETAILPVRFPGNMASAQIDFNAVGTAAMTITIDSVVYQEADAEDFPNGVWTNGASAADSATSLISAINGDTRATVPFTAKADVSGDGVILTWDAVGTAGNVTIASSTGDATVENSLGGEAAAIKQVVNLTSTITTNKLLAGGVIIPIPFTPTGFTFSCVSSAGVPIYTTDTFTIATSPDAILITTAGGTNLANTDIVYLTVWE